MSGNKGKLSRRAFLHSASALGIGSLLGPSIASGAAQGDGSQPGPARELVPKRPFGKTGETVSILSLGGVLRDSDQLIFRQAFQMGVTYWDTADSYGWGRNEKAIGKYFARFPEDRKHVFLVTKGASSDPRKLTEKLNTSLERLQTAYVDLYFIHYVSDVAEELTPEVKAWAEKAKAEGKIRFFGFSAHKNMENCMLEAAQLGWVDGIMMSYNYRLMEKESMKKAVDACAAAGIGLTAMKTQAAFSANFYASIGSETDEALQMTERMLRKGYTAEQAKLRVVWENPHIASICSAMPNMTILQANVAAALNRKNLSEGDRQRLQQFAQRTAPGYCAGCAAICESAAGPGIPISDVMRCSMYHHGYGDCSRARRHFHGLPTQGKVKMRRADYAEAERRCPQNMPIGKIMKQAVSDFS